MYILNCINFICLIFFLSCSSSNKETNKNIGINKSSNEALVTLQGNKTVNLILLNDFNDSLKIIQDGVIISEDLFTTNETTGSCKKQINLLVDTNKLSILLFIDNKNIILNKIDLIQVKNNLYVWKQDNLWSYKFTDSFKELE